MTLSFRTFFFFGFFQTIMDNMKSTVGILVGDINWYMFSTLVALAGTLAVQLFRRKGRMGNMLHVKHVYFREIALYTDL